MLDSFCIYFSKPWQPSSHYWEFFASPSTTHSSCKSPLAYLTAIAVFCLSTFFWFPLFNHLPFFAANEIVLIQHCITLGLQKHKNHSPITIDADSEGHSSCKSPLPYHHCSILFVKVFCFPLFIHLPIFAAI